MSRFRSQISIPAFFGVALLACFGTVAHAAERIVLKNGFDIVCDHRAAIGGNVRLYFNASGSNYMEVPASEIASAEHIALPAAPAAKSAQHPRQSPVPAQLSSAQLRPMLQRAGSAFDIDSDLLASIVRAESDGQTHAVSRAGAQGLMQLMPGTAAQLGIRNSFAPAQNIDGGAAYLDTLLIRYHDNLPLALAAYNAGPAAVARWHGIPPYPETRAYVARVIREYNRLYELRLRAEEHARAQIASAAHRP